jgi:hypothetical protein
METIDHKKEYKAFYLPPAKPTILSVPAFPYLKIDGKGNPNTSPDFQTNTNLLYTLSYTLRFAVKKSINIAYTVMPLEGLWWAEDMGSYLKADKDQWQWTLMIMQPLFITEEMVAEGKAEVIRKKKLAEVNQVRFEPYEAGTCVTMLHVGSYDDERPNIQWMHDYAREQGYELTGLHQEIYLSDPRKTAPEKMKTVLRQPIRRMD